MHGSQTTNCLEFEKFSQLMNGFFLNFITCDSFHVGNNKSILAKQPIEVSTIEYLKVK